MDATSHLADARTQVRLRRGLVGEHTGWYQRIHASLFHHGLPERSQLLTADGGAWLGRVELPAVARQAVEVALRMIDHLESNSTPSTPSWLASPGPSQAARRSSGAMDRAADRGGDLGRVRRRAPLRRQPPGSPLLCLDITITESDGKRARGHLARQGAPVLRWALHQAAMCATRPSAPDHADYLQVRQRLGGKRAALSLARKLAREASHTLRELGDQALVPAEFPTAA